MAENNNIPKHWQIKNLHDVCKELQSGKRPKGGVQGIESGTPSIGAEHLNYNGGFKFEKIKFVPKEYAEQMRRGVIKKDDIIVVKDGATTGKTSFVGNDFPFEFAVINEHVFIVRLTEYILPKFAFYKLFSSTGHKEVLEDFRGAAQGGISSGFLDKVKIPIPPLTEQQTIVSKIEELLSALENGKQQLQTAQQQLKAYRQSLLKWAFEGKLTRLNHDLSDLHDEHDLNMAAESQIEYIKNQGSDKLPEGWKWVKTGDIIDTINNGYTPTKEYLSQGSGEIPFIKVYNLNFDGTLNFKKNPTFIPDAIHKKELKRSICVAGDVLINIVGPPLGKVSIVTNQFPEWNINQAIVLFRPNEKILSKYISYFLQNPVTINWLEGTSKATAGQWNVKVSTCRVIPFPIPPIEEQHLIIQELESKLTVCDKIEETISHSLQQAETLWQSILKKAFEGRLV